MSAAPVQLVILKRGSPLSSVGKNTPNGKPRRAACPRTARRPLLFGNLVHHTSLAGARSVACNFVRLLTRPTAVSSAS